MSKQLNTKNFLLHNIFTFSNTDELANISQVNKNFNKITENCFQNSWMNKTQVSYCSEFNDSSLNNDFYFNESSHTYNWKSLYRQSNMIKCLWAKSQQSSSILSSEDIQNLENIIYSSFKNFEDLPELRKEKYYIETHLTSKLQTVLIDSLDDDSEKLGFYSSSLMNRRQKFNNEIELRDEYIPLNCIITNFDNILNSLSENEKFELSEIRWYNYSFNEKTIKNILISDNVNMTFLSMIKQIIYSIWSFCEINAQYTKSKEKNESQILDEYLKRYRKYVDGLICINKYCENINIAMNYIYSNIIDEREIATPHFSILRLGLIMWNRIVFLPLENAIFSNLSKLISGYFSSTIKSINRMTDNCGPIQDDYMIEEFSKYFADFSSNEFDVYYLNHSKFETVGIYNKFEEIFLIHAKEVLLKVQIDKEEVVAKLSNSIVFEHVLPRTKEKFLSFMKNEIINKAKPLIIKYLNERNEKHIIQKFKELLSSLMECENKYCTCTDKTDCDSKIEQFSQDIEELRSQEYMKILNSCLTIVKQINSEIEINNLNIDKVCSKNGIERLNYPIEKNLYSYGFDKNYSILNNYRASKAENVCQDKAIKYENIQKTLIKIN